MAVESPLAGWPKTVPLEGEEGYRVRARYFTPEGADVTTQLTAGVIAIASVVMLFAVLNGSFADSAQVFATAAALAVLGVVLWFCRFRIFRPVFGKLARIEIRPDVIRLGGRFGKYKNYDRTLPHAFDYTAHDMAEYEAEHDAREQQKAAARKTVGGMPRHYRRSFHIILRYAGQRIDVASVFGKKEAEALLTRLQLLDGMMDASAGEMAGPVRPEPAMQYGRRPEAG